MQKECLGKQGLLIIRFSFLHVVVTVLLAIFDLILSCKLNPPNAAILSVGASVKKPVLDSSGNLQAGETMTLGLSCDHRLVDGAVGARFLKLLGETLERPASLLV